MRAWLKGGLIGAGIGFVYFIISLIFSFPISIFTLSKTYEAVPFLVYFFYPLIVFGFFWLMIFCGWITGGGLISQCNERTVIWVVTFRFIASFIISFILGFIIGAIIGLIIGKLKQRKQEQIRGE